MAQNIQIKHKIDGAVITLHPETNSNEVINKSTKIAGDSLTEVLNNAITLEGSGPIVVNSKGVIGIADASTTSRGSVQLTDSTSSTSTDTAATPNSVKKAYDLAAGKQAKFNDGTATIAAKNGNVVTLYNQVTQSGGTIKTGSTLETLYNKAYIDSTVSTLQSALNGKTNTYAIVAGLTQAGTSNSQFNIPITTGTPSITMPATSIIVDTGGKTIALSNLKIGDVIYTSESNVKDWWLSSISSDNKYTFTQLDSSTATIPTATNTVLGGVKTGYSTSGKNYAVKTDSSGNAYVNVPWTDNNTTYTFAASGDVKLTQSGTSITYSYTLPTATTTALGGIKIGYSTNGKNYPIQLNDSGQAFVNVPWTDTVGVHTLLGSSNERNYLLGDRFSSTGTINTVYKNNNAYVLNGIVYSNNKATLTQNGVTSSGAVSAVQVTDGQVTAYAQVIKFYESGTTDNDISSDNDLVLNGLAFVAL